MESSNEFAPLQYVEVLTSAVVTGTVSTMYVIRLVKGMTLKQSSVPTKPGCIGVLPNELVREILKQLVNPKDICNVSQVCKRWMRLNESLWKWRCEHQMGELSQHLAPNGLPYGCSTWKQTFISYSKRKRQLQKKKNITTKLLGWMKPLIPASTAKKVLIGGLSNAGKTTLVFNLRYKLTSAFPPSKEGTSGTEVEVDTAENGVAKLKLFECPWDTHSDETCKEPPAMDGIIFLIDSADPARFPEARLALEALISNQHFWNIPILILGNKIDMTNSVTEEEMRNALGILFTSGVNTQKSPLFQYIRPIELFMVCMISGRFGPSPAFRWFWTAMNEYQH